MNTKTKTLVAVIAIGSALVAGSTYAATSTKANPMGSLVSAISQKFNLNANEVQAVFDADMKARHEENQAEKQQKMTERLGKAVQDGKITQDQVVKINAKMAELESSRSSLDGKTREEVKTIMKNEMEALKKWASDNGISMQYMQLGRNMGKGFGGRGFYPKADK